MRNTYNFKKLLKESVDDNRLQNNKAWNEKIKLFRKAKNILKVMQDSVVTTTSYAGKQYDKTMKTIKDMGWQDQFWDFCTGKHRYRQSFDEKPVRRNKSLKRNHRKFKQAFQPQNKYDISDDSIKLPKEVKLIPTENSKLPKQVAWLTELTLINEVEFPWELYEFYTDGGDMVFKGYATRDSIGYCETRLPINKINQYVEISLYEPTRQQLYELKQLGWNVEDMNKHSHIR